MLVFNFKSDIFIYSTYHTDEDHTTACDLIIERLHTYVSEQVKVKKIY